MALSGHPRIDGEWTSINAQATSQQLGSLLSMVIDKYECSVGSQAGAYIFGQQKTLMVPEQFGTIMRDASNIDREMAMAIAVPPSVMQLVNIGEPISEGQWLARLMSAESATAKVRAAWKTREIGLSPLALEASTFCSEAQPISAFCLFFDQFFTVDCLRSILSEAFPNQPQNGVIHYSYLIDSYKPFQPSFLALSSISKYIRHN